jgi:glucose-1-phosphate thymidylyltransferase
LAEAFIIGEEFIGTDPVCLILGDNIFYSSGLSKILTSISTEVKGNEWIEPMEGAIVFAYHVADPERYGVVEFASNGKVISIEEKPNNPKSKFAVPGLYFYDNQVAGIAKGVKPSARGELEITAINDHYLKARQLTTIVLERGTTWLDTGTIQTLHAASSYVQIIEERQGSKISCLEEIAWRNGWISNSKLEELASIFGNNPYGLYLKSLIDGS